MSFEVIVNELRTAAAKHDQLKADLGVVAFDETVAKPGVVGHTELAAWVDAIEQQITHANTALGDGQFDLAQSARDAAAFYVLADQDAEAALRSAMRHSPLFPEYVLPPQASAP